MAKRIAKDPEQMGPKNESLVNKISLTPEQAAFLKRISALESSSGKNTDHPEVNTGVQAGEHAVGQYGMMPNTIKEFSNRMVQQGNAPLVVQRINNMEDTQKAANQVGEDPELEQLYAKVMSQKVLDSQGTPDKAAYSWNQGTNLSPDAITEDKLNNSGYVQKFRNLKGTLK